MRLRRKHLLAVAGVIAQCANAIELNVDDVASIKQAASTVARGLVNFYTGGVTGQIISQIPGLLPGPYYWWEAGAMFGSLIDYFYYTGDDTYNEIITQALLFQVGPDVNYMPPNQSKSLGNDDQCFWALSAMSAAETKYPNPLPDDPQWLALAQAVFNSQAHRWDMSTCQGGLRWQIYPFNLGYDYKNAISNGCFFNLAARLGAYTHNTSYFDWATKAWDWTQNIHFIGDNWMVFDGSSDLDNCTDISNAQWTYNAGIFLLGSAVMWNQTTGSEQALWQSRVENLLTAAHVFFKNNVMYEAACEPIMSCNNDQLSFKAYFSRWLAATAKVAPFVHDEILSLLQTSAQAAAVSCSGGNDGATCGTRWTENRYDGTTGVGQQMCALEVIQTTLLDTVSGPVSKSSGGTSTGNPSAGGESDDIVPISPITNADRAGAGVITAIAIVFLLSGSWWLVS